MTRAGLHLAFPSLTLSLALTLLSGGCTPKDPPMEEDGALTDLHDRGDLRKQTDGMGTDPDLREMDDLRDMSDMGDMEDQRLDDLPGRPDFPPPPDLPSPPDLPDRPDFPPFDLPPPLDLPVFDLPAIDLPLFFDLPPFDLPPPPIDLRLPDLARPDLPPPSDLGRPDMPPTDMPPTDMATGGKVGAPCTADANCTQGTRPTCWKTTLFNNPMYLPVPSGYCSSSCTTDGDCGMGNLCLDFGADGKHCLAGCKDAVTCRHPGYVCTFLDEVGSKAACFPDSLWDCNPKIGTCLTGGGDAGGCFRQAYEDDKGGYCLEGCKVGNACPADKFGSDTQCLYLDFAPDAWKGTLCYPSTGANLPDGAACSYVSDCVDGSQCDLKGAKTCTKLCDLGGGAPRCVAPMTCRDSFMIGMGAGLCK